MSKENEYQKGGLKKFLHYIQNLELRYQQNPEIPRRRYQESPEIDEKYGIKVSKIEHFFI